MRSDHENNLNLGITELIDACSIAVYLGFSDIPHHCFGCNLYICRDADCLLDALDVLSTCTLTLRVRL